MTMVVPLLQSHPILPSTRTVTIDSTRGVNTDSNLGHPPTIVHQVWFDFGSAILSEDHEYLIRRNRRIALDDGFEYILWNLDSADEFLRTHYPYFRSFLLSEHPFNIVKCDFFRYLVMYHYGGIYIDLDFYMLNTFKEMYDRMFEDSDTDVDMNNDDGRRRVLSYKIASKEREPGTTLIYKSELAPISKDTTIVLTEEWFDSICSGNLEDSRSGSLHNGFIVSRPRSPFWWDMICDIYATFHEVRKRDDVWKISGTQKLRNALVATCRRSGGNTPSSPSSPNISCIPYYYTCPYKCVPKSSHYGTLPFLCISEDARPLDLKESDWVFLNIREVEREDAIRVNLQRSIAVCVVASGGSLWMND